ncbi:unnamed protein product [Protopolystoma xenopodis]|uniref:Uncharacterized protein n=1 Tax=Protopolystoma xenopodis TaxID=117903 RepID=A0A3S5ABL7_9PLAT|nr:unnamed protein product [Protopolystoma xenopodis]
MAGRRASTYPNHIELLHDYSGKRTALIGSHLQLCPSEVKESCTSPWAPVAFSPARLQLATVWSSGQHNLANAHSCGSQGCRVEMLVPNLNMDAAKEPGAKSNWMQEANKMLLLRMVRAEFV